MNFDRRDFIKSSVFAATVVSLGERLSAEEEAAGGAINHSVCKWCYKGISLEDLCIAGKEFGLQSVELLKPSDMPTLRKHGMTCAIATNPLAEGPTGKKVGGIRSAWNRIENHDVLVEAYESWLKECVDVGIKNVICFSGNRAGMDDETGLKNCAIGLKRIVPTAEKLGVTVSMELLNSKVNHKDYMCDLSKFGVELCDAIGSDNFKLLYDIYHMQIMEGDVIATIRKQKDYFSHYHTGGVPGRAEIDDTQELNYPAIARAIKETGYSGFIGQEFIPKRPDKIGSLRQGVEICTV